MKNSAMVKLILASLMIFNAMSAADHSGRKASLKNVATNESGKPVTINNIFSYYNNNGDGSQNPFTGQGGFEIVDNKCGSTLFEEGLLWGGMHNGMLKVGGSTYNHGLQAGPIVTTGTATTSPIAANPGSSLYRIYRVRPDINPKTPLDAAMRLKITNEEVALIGRYESVKVEEIFDAYLNDWNEWPASEGAPYHDLNSNGVYDPGSDIPGVPGADQTLWYVANDLDRSRTLHLYGSEPIGLEFQRTIWAYKQFGPLSYTIFQKNTLINKSGSRIDSMYIGQWADPDVGGPAGYQDDFTGCDTVLGVGYAYNGTDNDGFFGAAPPAVGIQFVQGPIVKGLPSDVATFNGGTRPGYKNLGMSAFNFFINGNNLYSDPALDNPSGLQEAYHLLNGVVTTTGLPYVNPITGAVTKYILSGDPVSGSGWIDGQIAGPGDRRMALCTGPFTMAAGDTQEVIVAAMVGQGANRLQSVSRLLQASKRIQVFINGAAMPSITPVGAYAQINVPLELHGSIANPRVTASATGQWVIVAKPSGSTAAIQSVETVKASVTPDLPGIYTIGYQAIVASSVVGEDDVTFTATHNHPPVAAIHAPAQVTVGDKFYYDGASSADQDTADTLQYLWTISGGDRDMPRFDCDTIKTSVMNATAVQASTIALRAGTLTLSLDVNDGTWTTNAQKAVVVNPMKTPSTLQCSTVPVSQTPYLGFYSAGPFRYDTKGVLWANISGSLFPVNFLDIKHPLQSYAVGGVQNYCVSNDAIYLVQGSNSILILITSGGSLTGTGYIQNMMSNRDTMFTDVYAAGNHVFVSNGLQGLWVFDVANPMLPVMVASVTNGQFWGNFAADGNTLIGVHARTAVMTAVNIEDPSSPKILASYPLPRAYGGIKKIGSYYCFSTADTIGIYDCSNPQAPLLKSEIPVPQMLNAASAITDLAGDGSTLMVTTTEGVYFYDVVNPSAPVLIGKYLTGTPYVSAYLGHGLVWAFNYAKGVAGGNDGLDSFEGLVTSVPERACEAVAPHEFALLQNYPNPFNPTTKIGFTVPHAGKAVLKIYNLLGEEVAMLFNGIAEAGQYHYLQFDAKNFASGIYFARLQFEREMRVEKIMLMK